MTLKLDVAYAEAQIDELMDRMAGAEVRGDEHAQRINELEQRLNAQAKLIRELQLWVTQHVAQRGHNTLERTP